MAKMLMIVGCGLVFCGGVNLMLTKKSVDSETSGLLGGCLRDCQQRNKCGGYGYMKACKWEDPWGCPGPDGKCGDWCQPGDVEEKRCTAEGKPENCVPNYTGTMCSKSQKRSCHTRANAYHQCECIKDGSINDTCYTQNCFTK